ncbi:phage tail protein [Paenibacillus phocaensis]|uniref:phage tail protein n=1 Tax=Paenibacillus phocaensis TaxID=1776378 RepID=UPI000839B776|nr:phage tail protein [Paenibacillus phocaensis]
MPIATFKNKIFAVSASKIYTLTGMEWSGALDTEAQEKLKSKPSTYIKGQTLGTMSFEIPLIAGKYIDVRAQIEDWEKIRDKATPDYFILGKKPLGKYKWLLKSVAVSDTQIDGKGNILRAKLKLEFEEYVRAGSAQASKKNKKAKTSDKTPVHLDIVPTSYIDKTEAKRSNVNATTARTSTVEARLNSMGV